MERGQTKTITISWVPPADFDVGAFGFQASEPWERQRLGGLYPCPIPGEEVAAEDPGESGGQGSGKTAHLPRVPTG